MDHKPALRIASEVYLPPRAGQPWRLERLLKAETVRYYSCARHALVTALSAAKVRPGEEVLVPELICRDLLASLHAVGAKPLFYPVDKRLEPEHELPKTRLAIAVDYFGFPQNLSAFRKSDVVIEDNAHGLFSRDENGEWLGTRADFGLFSLKKTVDLPNGGALVMPLKSRFHAPEQIDFKEAATLRHRLKRHLRRAAAPFGGRPLRALHGAWQRLRGDIALEPEGVEAETGLPPSANPCLELSRPLHVADAAREIRRRRVLYALSESIVLKAEGISVFPELPGGVSPYGYPFFADSWRVARVQKALRARGLEAFPWPDLPAAVHDSAPPHYRGLWCVRFLW